MIGTQEEATLRGAVLKLAKDCEELKENVNSIVSAQEKVDSSLQELARAKSTGSPVQVMETGAVAEVIRENLNSALIESTVNVRVNDPVVKINEQLEAKINEYISAAEDLVKSNKTIRPRRPLININIHDSENFFWIGLSFAGMCLIACVLVIVLYLNTIKSIKGQPFYLGNRAYQAARLLDKENPGDAYHVVMSKFPDEPERVKKYVNGLEKKSLDYQKIKTELSSLLSEKDKREIRIITWKGDIEEYWILYRFFDEEIERSIHRWPDGKVEETTDKIVKDLATAQKYSKRKIWRVLKEAEPKAEQK